jgi:hypothetical protein
MTTTNPNNLDQDSNGVSNAQVHQQLKSPADNPNVVELEAKYYYSKGRLILTKRPFSEVEEIPPGAVEEVVFDQESYENHFEVWHKEKIRLEQEFKNDLIYESGVSDMVKAGRCFSLTWDYGCSHGLSEVHDYFKDMIELVD